MCRRWTYYILSFANEFLKWTELIMAGIALMLSAVCMNATCSSNSTTTEGVQLIEGNSTFPAVNPVNDNPQSFIDKRMDFYYFLSCWISIFIYYDARHAIWWYLIAFYEHWNYKWKWFIISSLSLRSIVVSLCSDSNFCQVFFMNEIVWNLRTLFSFYLSIKSDEALDQLKKELNGKVLKIATIEVTFIESGSIKYI